MLQQNLFILSLKMINVYLIFQVPIKHRKRIDDIVLPNVAENVSLTTIQVQTAPSRMPVRPRW